MQVHPPDHLAKCVAHRRGLVMLGRHDNRGRIFAPDEGARIEVVVALALAQCVKLDAPMGVAWEGPRTLPRLMPTNLACRVIGRA